MRFETDVERPRHDHGVGSGFDGSERAPHQAYSGGLQERRRSGTRPSTEETWPNTQERSSRQIPSQG